MPPKKRIFREDILNAALGIIRRGGVQALTVRTIAGELSCSTQPVYSEFGSLDALKEELPSYAAKRYLHFSAGSYKDFALGFLRFAQTEKELFKFLYLRRRGPGETLLDDANYEETVMLLQRNLEMSEQDAREMHRRMQFQCYAMGVMMATDYLELSEEQIGRELTDFYRIMLRHYKSVQSDEELRYWLDRSRHLI